jgi:PTS system galactitol-specific IIA component
MDKIRNNSSGRKSLLAFHKDLVLLNVEAATDVEVINLLAGKLHTFGLVSGDYGRLTCERELEHPTGLPTKPYCIAIPHADPGGVLQSSLAFASLRTPVKFKSMEDPDITLDVHLVIMLANNSPEEQIQTLRNLAVLFSNSEKIKELKNQLTVEKTATWLDRELGLTGSTS